MDKEIVFEDKKYIASCRDEALRKAFAINHTLDDLLEKLGCKLSDDEVLNFMLTPDKLFEIVCENLIEPSDVRVDVIKQTIADRLEPIEEDFKYYSRGLDDNRFIVVKDGKALFDEEAFEKAMDAHRTMIDSEPRRKAWEMAQKIVSDIEKLEKYLQENQMGRVQPHAIGTNTNFDDTNLIHYYDRAVKLEPKAIGYIK